MRCLECSRADTGTTLLLLQYCDECSYERDVDSSVRRLVMVLEVLRGAGWSFDAAEHV